MDVPFADLSFSSSSSSSQAPPDVPPTVFPKMHEVLTRLANRHNNLDPDTWGFKVPRYIDIDNDCRISRLAQFTLETASFCTFWRKIAKSLLLNAFGKSLK